MVASQMRRNKVFLDIFLLETFWVSHKKILHKKIIQLSHLIMDICWFKLRKLSVHYSYIFHLGDYKEKIKQLKNSRDIITRHSKQWWSQSIITDFQTKLHRRNILFSFECSLMMIMGYRTYWFLIRGPGVSLKYSQPFWCRSCEAIKCEAFAKNGPFCFGSGARK